VVSSAIAVTGATGMTGQHAVEAISRSDNTAIPVTRSNWDLTRWASVESLNHVFGDACAVIHAGASTPKGPFDNLEMMIAANVTACAALCEWALSRKVHIVYLSGAIVYADNAVPPLTEDSPVAAVGFGGIYRLSKVMAENVFHHFIERGLRCTILRATSIFGTGMSPEKSIPQFLKLAQSNKEINLNPPIDDEVDLVHAWDVAQAALLAIENKITGVFNIGSETPSQIHEIAQSCIQVAGAGRVNIKHSSPKAPPPAPTRKFIVSCERARTQLGFKSVLNLSDGLSLMANEQIAPNNL